MYCCLFTPIGRGFQSIFREGYLCGSRMVTLQSRKFNMPNLDCTKYLKIKHSLVITEFTLLVNSGALICYTKFHIVWINHHSPQVTSNHLYFK